MVKIVAISDTHGHHRSINIPKGDILVHTGDFSRGSGSIEQVKDFNNWLGSLNFDNIVCIAGNHDFPLETNLKECKEILTNCIYLHDNEVIINGVKFYGSPWQPWFCDWAFNLQRGKQLEAVWSLIPEDTDVLLTHGPPVGIGDLTTWESEHVGCEDLMSRVMKIKPKIHVFGHIHEGFSHIEYDNIHFINASICNLQYQPVNKPWEIELDVENKKIISVL